MTEPQCSCQAARELEELRAEVKTMQLWLTLRCHEAQWYRDAFEKVRLLARERMPAVTTAAFEAAQAARDTKGGEG